MINKTLNSEAYRTLNNKENYTTSFLTYDTESMMQLLTRNEQAILEMRRDIREKVGRHEFLTALSSKVSLSDVSNLSLDINQSYETNYSRAAEKERQQSIMEVKSELQKIKQDINEINARTNYQEYIDGKQCTILKLIREGEQSLLDKLQKKAERSELDKIMHLSSLLAIEFELIKKRFGNFQVDYNLIWKQISNLYSYQENIKTALDTERVNVGSVERQIKQISDKEKQLQILLRTSQKISGMSSLFKSLGVSPKRQDDKEAEEEERIDYGLRKLEQKLQNIRMSELNTQFSIKSFSERLRVLEDDHENWLNSMKQIHQLKDDYIQAKQQVSCLYTKTDSFKDTVVKSMKQKMNTELQQLNINIKAEIVQACEEISQRVMTMFGECARESDLILVRSTVDQLDQQLANKINAILQTHKKSNEHFSSKLELQQDKLRIIQKDLGHRLKTQEFNKELQNLITSEATLTLVKKVESNLKQEVSKFVSEQQSINQVICAQTVIARWLWISGELKGGNLVSWDKEIINTLPENFKYSNKEYCFKITSSGIYRIEMGYYSKKKPTVQIIVNGQTVVSAINSNAYVLHHSSGKLKDVGNGEITGLTYYDFLMLPENSRLAISYQGESGHGFLGIQRL